MDVFPFPIPVPFDLPTVFVPIYSGKIAAGQSRFPSPAQDYELDRLDLNKRFITNQPATYFFEVTGDSMVDAGILPGSILTVNRAITPKSSHIVVALLEGEWMVKRLSRRGGTVKLLSENKAKAYPSIQPKDGQELVVWGVVTSVHTSTI